MLFLPDNSPSSGASGIFLCCALENPAELMILVSNFQCLHCYGTVPRAYSYVVCENIQKTLPKWSTESIGLWCHFWLLYRGTSSLTHLCLVGECLTNWANSQDSFIAFLKIIYCILNYVCMWIWVQVPVEARTGHHIVWGSNYRGLWAPSTGCWKLNSDSLKEQQALLITEAPPQAPSSPF